MANAPTATLTHAEQPSATRDWVEAIARQFDQFAPLRDLPQPPASAKRVAIFAVVPWWHSCVEYLIATSLRLRGVRVATILCGGGYPACSNESAQMPRPACDVCLTRGRRYATAFCLEALTTRDFVTSADFVRAARFVVRLPANELVQATYDGLAIGYNALRDLSQYYHYPVRELTPAEQPAMRRFLISSIVNADLARRVHEELKPDIVIVSNGKAIAYASIYSYFLSRGVETITWDESPCFRNGFIFNRNCYATETHLEEPWQAQEQVALTASQERLVRDYFTKWRAGHNARYLYHEGSRPDSEDLRAIQARAAGRPIITFFSNLTWETSHLGRNVGFDHLLDAVYWLIEYARDHPRFFLVIRTHPAEVKTAADCRTVVPLPESIRQRFPQLPANVAVLTADSTVNSYSLADASDVLCVYTSTLGFEMALAGRATFLLGESHYRGKGFTIDIDSPEHLQAHLDEFDRRSVLTPEQVALAERYAYSWVFRHVVRIPYLDEVTRHKYVIDDPRDLLPGSGTVIDRLTDAILSGGPLLDISGGNNTGRAAAPGPPGSAG